MGEEIYRWTLDLYQVWENILLLINTVGEVKYLYEKCET